MLILQFIFKKKIFFSNIYFMVKFVTVAEIDKIHKYDIINIIVLLSILKKGCD